MAFPIAHPAAILPFRRFCPKFLSPSALIVGSMVPDVAYVFGDTTWRNAQWDWRSHHFPGSFYFSVPVGLVLLMLFYTVRASLVHLLPPYQQRLFMPLCHAPVAPPLVLVFSLLLGSWTHLAWDSFTHAYGWFTLHWAWLQIPVLQLGRRRVLVCQVVWYITSFAGIVWLMLAFKQWQRKVDPAVSPSPGWRKALLAACLFFPVELAHHFIGGIRGVALTGFGTLLLLLIFLLTIETPSSAETAQPA